ncbi:ABC transporter ATP-binding protein [Actinoallomurus sp. CA-150999]|uniref:ABC transporter ATP-binding protein n=1 Tax=Actinoallomurus sp. CA-150999 TaxID=3239887 RepID=UPI003D90AAB2
MADAAIRTVGLSKTYSNGRVAAVSELDLEIPPGEFFGLLGPNGAGKSTTIGMLVTRIRPTNGSAYVAGIDVMRRPVEAKRRIAVVSQNVTLDRSLTIAQNLELRGRLFGMSGRQARRRCAELLEQFDLADRGSAKVGWVSGGQARRIMIARALMHRPEVLFLDEPTSGIDPQTRVNLWTALRALHASGQTILLTTHYLEEADALCDRVGVVDKGRLLACDTADGLKAAAGADTVLAVEFDGDAEPVVADVERLSGTTRVLADGSRLRVHTTKPDGILGDLVNVSAYHGLSIRNAAATPPSLETAFLTLTGREYSR